MSATGGFAAAAALPRKRKRGRPRKTLLTGARFKVRRARRGRPTGSTYKSEEVAQLVARHRARVEEATARGERLSLRRSARKDAYEYALEYYRTERNARARACADERVKRRTRMSVDERRREEERDKAADEKLAKKFKAADEQKAKAFANREVTRILRVLQRALAAEKAK